jgi:hypothetical protein
VIIYILVQRSGQELGSKTKNYHSWYNFIRSLLVDACRVLHDAVGIICELASCTDVTIRHSISTLKKLKSNTFRTRLQFQEGAPESKSQTFFVEPSCTTPSSTATTAIVCNSGHTKHIQGRHALQSLMSSSWTWKWISQDLVIVYTYKARMEYCSSRFLRALVESSCYSTLVKLLQVAAGSLQHVSSKFSPPARIMIPMIQTTTCIES